MAVKQTATKPEGPTGEFQGDIKVNDTPPSKSILDKCAKMTVFDAQKKPHTFKSLYEQPGKRVLIVFIRHFFCGNCQEYIRTLTRELPPSTLSSLSTPTELVVIGCGTTDLIPMYIKETSCPYPLYADYTKKLYSAMGMTRTLALGNKDPDYMKQSIGRVAVQSIFQELRSGKKMLSGGDFWQVGGEFIFETDGHVSWCHRMRNTRDHAEMPVLKKQLQMAPSRSGTSTSPPQPAATATKTVGSRKSSGSTGSGLVRRLSDRRKSWRGGSLGSGQIQNDSASAMSVTPMDRVKEETEEKEKDKKTKRLSRSNGKGKASSK